MAIPTCYAYPLENYRMTTRDHVQDAQDETLDQFFQRMSAEVSKQGPRTTVEAVLLTHIHSYPHILLLDTSGPRGYRLPGGKLDPGESELAGLKRSLTNKLCPTGAISWDLGELLGVYYRPEFTQNLYPFMPPHSTLPKETIKVFLCQLPQETEFIQAKNLKLVAIPLHELKMNTSKFGGYLSDIPTLLSRININLIK
ncbi:hypothetical protein GEMRC1_000486 [Eukaryota sp. GEM-RC1]